MCKENKRREGENGEEWRWGYSTYVSIGSWIGGPASLLPSWNQGWDLWKNSMSWAEILQPPEGRRWSVEGWIRSHCPSSRSGSGEKSRCQHSKTFCTKTFSHTFSSRSQAKRWHREPYLHTYYVCVGSEGRFSPLVEEGFCLRMRRQQGLKSIQACFCIFTITARCIDNYVITVFKL